MSQWIQEFSIYKGMINPRPNKNKQNTFPRLVPRMRHIGHQPRDIRDTKGNAYAPRNTETHALDMSLKKCENGFILGGGMMCHSSELFIKGPPEGVRKGIYLALPKGQLRAHLALAGAFTEADLSVFDPGTEGRLGHDDLGYKPIQHWAPPRIGTLKLKKLVPMV